MTRHHHLTRVLLIGSLCLPAIAAAGQSFASEGGAAVATPADDYAQGTQALDQQRWQDAITSFDRIVTAHGKRADAALYWKAYALNKLGRSGLVVATCNQLHSTFPRSTWNRDCSTLLAAAADPGIFAGGQRPADHDGSRRAPQPKDDGIYLPNGADLPNGNAERLRQLQQQLQSMHLQAGPNADRLRALRKQLDSSVAAGLTAEQFQNLQQQIQTMRIDAGPNAEQIRDLQLRIQSMPTDAGLSAGNDADLKMLALNSVLQRDPAQALPVIRNILTGTGSPQLKQRALTALAMSQSTDAFTLLNDVATGKTAPTEQREAIQMLGVFQGKRADDTLAQIYRSSPRPEIKEAALNALFVAGDAPRLVDLARNEKDLSRKHDIVTKLALMRDKAATDYMLELLK